MGRSRKNYRITRTTGGDIHIGGPRGWMIIKPDEAHSVADALIDMAEGDTEAKHVLAQEDS